MNLSNYIFICFFLTTILMYASKPAYTAAGYNPAEDKIIVRQENLPEHVYIHEGVHQTMRPLAWTLFFAAVLTTLGLALGTQYTKWPYLLYVALSMYMELTAYILTPIDITLKLIYILVITGFAVINIYFWQYLFYKTDISKPLKESTLRDAIYPILLPWAFWII